MIFEKLNKILLLYYLTAEKYDKVLHEISLYSMGFLYVKKTIYLQHLGE